MATYKLRSDSSSARRHSAEREGRRQSGPWLPPIWTALFVVALALGWFERVVAAELPPVSDRTPVAAPHFPDAMHAVVWRNWQLVAVDRLAAVLGTSEENVKAVAASMGFPRDAVASPDMQTRGYITLLRRNWHLLPYEQLLELLQISGEELAFRLREDDFLYIKLGSIKPECPPVKYRQPDPAAQARAAEIRAIVQKHFGDVQEQSAEPRFGFLQALAGKVDVQSQSQEHRLADHPRFIYSYCAMFGDSLSDPRLDPYPDALLSQLAARGVNGVWLHTVLRQLAPGGPHFPELGEGHEDRLRNLRNLVERARRHGIDVYLYINEPRAMPHDFFRTHGEAAGVRSGEFTAMCTSDPQVRKWLSDSLAHVFREVPGLGGVFTITASENFTNCASHGGREGCPRCAKQTDADIIAEVNAVIAEGVHRSAPEAKVIAYDWGWNGHGDARATIERLPDSIWLMSVSEWGLPIERAGTPSAVGEYSLSAVGPGPRSTLHWRHAKQHGLKTIAKVQFNNSWELSSVPYLPVLDLVAEHCERLSQADIDGMMLSWSLGGYPSMNLEAAAMIAGHSGISKEGALNTVAERHFGVDAAPRVRQAWTQFSDAFRGYPFHISVLYNAPQQMGPANLLYGQPTGYSATMVGIPYDDLDRWRGPYPAEVFAAQFEKVANGWSKGLVHLESAQRLVPEHLREKAQADLRVAKAAQIHFASVANQARFVVARDARRSTSPRVDDDQMRQNAIALIEREIELAKELYELSSTDSRLGYEASNHYFYVPNDLIEKVINCEYVRLQLPAAASADTSN